MDGEIDLSHCDTAESMVAWETAAGKTKNLGGFLEPKRIWFINFKPPDRRLQSFSPLLLVPFDPPTALLFISKARHLAVMGFATSHGKVAAKSNDAHGYQEAHLSHCSKNIDESVSGLACSTSPDSLCAELVFPSGAEAVPWIIALPSASKKGYPNPRKRKPPAPPEKTKILVIHSTPGGCCPLARTPGASPPASPALASPFASSEPTAGVPGLDSRARLRPKAG